MRFVYLDESGLGDPVKDPFVVVAGVIVDADRQWQSLEKRLKSLAKDCEIAGRDKPVIFHATHLFSGGGYFDRKTFSEERRWEILQTLCGLPNEFDLPIVGAFTERKNFTDGIAGGEKRTVEAQVITSLACTLAVERFMRQNAPDGEVAAFVYENNEQARIGIRRLHDFVRGGPSRIAPVSENGDILQYVPVQRIVETAYFAEKTDTSILQVADMLAFCIKRKLSRSPNWECFFEPLKDRYLKNPIVTIEIKPAVA